MRLTVENFFSCLIFHPFQANTKKDTAIALAASIACGIFSIGICHVVCAIRNCFTHRSSDDANEQDRRVSELRDSALHTTQSLNKSKVHPIEPLKASVKIQVTIPTEVKATLDQLFEESSYSIDKLLVYPVIINTEKHVSPERKNMTAPIMKGTTDDGRPFIAIKVNCDLKDKDIEKYARDHAYKEEIQNHYKTHRKLEDILILYQYHSNGSLYWEGEGQYMWDQLDRGREMAPSFFTGNFTSPEDGTGPTKSQESNFKLVQTLLKTGESSDTNGLIWRISV